jgi:subtilisin family serine protease
MANHKYIILRDESKPVNLGHPFARGLDVFRGLEASLPETRIHVEDLSKNDVVDLQRDPQVKAVAPPMPVVLIEPTSAKEAGAAEIGQLTWGVEVTGAANSPYTGDGVTAAVLDTGIDPQHEAFAGVELIRENFTDGDDNDVHGHGTHCAGTIFGRAAGGGRFGVAPGIKRALIGKVLGEGGGTSDQICRAVLWAVDNGAHIISMSLGLDFPGFVDYLVKRDYPVDLATSKALEAYSANTRLFEELAGLVRARGMFSQGTILVAAAGNESKRHLKPDYEITVAPPAAADGIVSVGALSTSGSPHNALKVADFSNTGPNISAPGVDILSAKKGGGYVKMSGTSMATPHVAGLAALWAEKLRKTHGYLKPDDLIHLFIGHAKTDRLAAGFDAMDVGAGLVMAPSE